MDRLLAFLEKVREVATAFFWAVASWLQQHLPLLGETLAREIRENAVEIATFLLLAVALALLTAAGFGIAALHRKWFGKDKVAADVRTTSTSNMITPPPRPTIFPRLGKARRVVVPGQPVAKTASAPAAPQVANPVVLKFRRGGGIELSPAEIAKLRRLGSGGEGVVYELIATTGEVFAVKIYHDLNGPYFAGTDEETQRNKRRAVVRMGEYPDKLPKFPTGMPEGVVAPQHIIYYRDKLIGYAMPLIGGGMGVDELCKQSIQKAKGITDEQIIECLLEMLAIIKGVHACGAVIGDVKPANFMLLPDGHVRLADAESMQFAGFPCHSFTERYVDPQICDPDNPIALMKNQQYSTESDWYSFCVIAFEARFGCTPYEGQQLPTFGEAVSPGIRPLKGVTVFDSDMKPLAMAKLPSRAELKASPALKALWDYFHQVFEKGHRGVFPRELLEALLPEERRLAIKRRVTEFWDSHTVKPSGSDLASENFGVVRSIPGVFIASSVVNGNLRVLEQQGAKLLLNAGTPGAEVVLLDRYNGEFAAMQLHGDALVGSSGNGTIYIAREGQKDVIEMTSDHPHDGHPIAASDGKELFFTAHGSVRAVSDPETELVKVQHRPLIFGGVDFGVMVVEEKNGKIDSVRILDTQARKVIDTDKLPHIRGKVSQVTATFTPEHAWLFITSAVSDTTWSHAILYNKQGRLIAFGFAEAGSAVWLGQPGPRVAARGVSGQPMLLALGTNGVEVIEVDNGFMFTTKLLVLSDTPAAPFGIQTVNNEIVLISNDSLTFADRLPDSNAPAQS